MNKVAGLEAKREPPYEEKMDPSPRVREDDRLRPRRLL
jgi:hypothetical protein